jgi:hypothetical protein
MVELELATTDQILDELGKRPIKFVHVSTNLDKIRPEDGYIAYSPTLNIREASQMLRRAEQVLLQGDRAQS